MSSMLEQAILDAKELKEAAIKNAQQALIEKYSNEFEGEVEKLLEQVAPAPEAQAAPAPAVPLPGMPIASGQQPVDPKEAKNDSDVKSSIFDKLEYAYADGEVIGDKVHPTGLVEIDLDSISEYSFSKNKQTDEQLALQELKKLTKKSLYREQIEEEMSTDEDYDEDSSLFPYEDDDDDEDFESEDDLEDDLDDLENDLDDEDFDDEEAEMDLEDDDLDDEDLDDEGSDIDLEDEEDLDLDIEDEEFSDEDDLEDEDLYGSEDDIDFGVDYDTDESEEDYNPDADVEDFDLDDLEDEESEEEEEDLEESKSKTKRGLKKALALGLAGLTALTPAPDAAHSPLKSKPKNVKELDEEEDLSEVKSLEKKDIAKLDNVIARLEAMSRSSKEGSSKSKIEASVRELKDILELLSDSDKQKLKEAIKLDYKRSGPKSPWNGMFREEAEHDLMLAQLQAQIEELEQDVDQLQENNKKLKSGLKDSVRLNEDLSKKLSSYEEKLFESRFLNYKLLYTNKVLVDASLNERQKNRIAESINGAKTAEEVKLLYETLKSTMRDGTSNNSSPKSLSEAVERRSSSLLLRGSRAEPKKQDDYAERMKKLAGLA